MKRCTLVVLNKHFCTNVPVPTSPRTSALTTVMVGPQRLGPTISMGQALAKHARRGGRGVLGIGVKGDEASDLDDPNSKDKSKEVVSKPHSSYQ